MLDCVESNGVLYSQISSDVHSGKEVHDSEECILPVETAAFTLGVARLFQSVMMLTSTYRNRGIEQSFV